MEQEVLQQILFSCHLFYSMQELSDWYFKQVPDIKEISRRIYQIRTGYIYIFFLWNAQFVWNFMKGRRKPEKITWMNNDAMNLYNNFVKNLGNSCINLKKGWA